MYREPLYYNERTGNFIQRKSRAHPEACIKLSRKILEKSQTAEGCTPDMKFSTVDGILFQWEDYEMRLVWRYAGEASYNIHHPKDKHGGKPGAYVR